MFDRPTARRARTWLTAGAVTALTAAAPAAAAPDPDSGWHGRAIERPQPARPAANTAWPPGWSAGSVALGAGAVSGSRRVRAVQRELRARGYGVGRVDGRFGARTRDAVTWFQVKHGLEPTGTVDAGTLAELRTRRSPQVTLARAPEPTAVPARAAATPATNLPGAILLALLSVATLALLALWLRAERRARPQAPVPAAAPTMASRAVLGYISLEPDARERIAVATAAIAAWCEARDWHLERVIHDGPHAGHPSDRPGLAYVMDRLRTGQACGVVVPHLSDIADSAAELAPMLQWVNDAGAFVMAVDDLLDASLPPGRMTAGALVEISEYRRTRATGHARSGRTATLRDVPELRARIVAMHERGMSLQAIADTLTAASVPTLRGGSRWRPSDVQVLAGYKPPPTQTPVRRNG